MTMNKKREILRNSSILLEGNKIAEVETKKTKADQVINASGMIVLPGFINGHHHMFQCALRGMPQLQNQTIDKWIKIVCQATKKMDEEIIYYSALANMAELLLYGCTTSTDMMYIFPKGKKGFFEATVKAAKDIGIRFHPYYGSMSLSQKDGALFPDDVVQESDLIVSESEKMIKKFHNPKPFSMLRIGLAPCTIFTSTKEDYKNAVLLSKKHQVNLQTHLSESEYENQYSLKKFGKRPLSYLNDLGWQGKRVSFVHCINLTKEEIKELAEAKINVVHCPISNARSPIGEFGVAPVWEMLEKKVNIAIGVDGSAGNDSSNILEELRWARILQGVRKESTYLKPNQVLEIGIINGAKLLNWENEIGSIEEDKVADVAIFKPKNKIEHAGAIWNLVSSLIANQAIRAHTVIVHGKIIVKDGRISTVSEEEICRKIRNCQNKLIN